MSLSCPGCGAHGSPPVVDGRLVCAHCGTDFSRPRVPLLVVTGAGATGKSTVCSALAERVPALAAIDGDVMAAGAAAVAGDQPDYRGFWAHLIEVSLELAANGLTTAWCGICRPDQLINQPRLAAFTSVQLLVLTCAVPEHRERLAGRLGGGAAAARPDRLIQLNAALTRARTGGGLIVEHLDTTHLDRAATADAATSWATGVLPRPFEDSAI